MKIWFDITNSPHVHFFAALIKELQQDHELLITCRPLSNTIELLDIYRFSYTLVGRHYGKNLMLKSLGFFIRILQLYHFLKKKNIDTAISHSSFYSPLVSKLVRARCIYMNDNEHALGNKISFKFADRIMVPEFLDVKKITCQGAKEEKIVRYPGLKEGVYLWNYVENSFYTFRFENSENKKIIFIRPEPLTAQYYKGKQNFLNDLLIDLKDIYKIVLLPRSKTQANHYRHEKYCKIQIPEKSVSLADIMGNCDLFIGAGGTMTREAAVLGIPTISIYQDSLLDVDKFLIKKGHMAHKKDLNADYVINYLTEIKKKAPDKQLLKKGKKAYELIRQTLLQNIYQ